jgi:1-aminocyclopropane-1-carboxylate deaminase/D-cysteine desulfhydrase-like pyridoxal-dependent ACC family enzyme
MTIEELEQIAESVKAENAKFSITKRPWRYCHLKSGAAASRTTTQGQPSTLGSRGFVEATSETLSQLAAEQRKTRLILAQVIGSTMASVAAALRCSVLAAKQRRPSTSSELRGIGLTTRSAKRNEGRPGPGRKR